MTKRKRDASSGPGSRLQRPRGFNGRDQPHGGFEAGAAQPRIDPVTGQRGAFSLEEPTDDDGDPQEGAVSVEAIAYLRAVR